MNSVAIDAAQKLRAQHNVVRQAGKSAVYHQIVIGLVLSSGSHRRIALTLAAGPITAAGLLLIH
jgi:hypothetical protein